MFKSRRSPSEGGDAGAPPDLLAGPRHEPALRGRGRRVEALAGGADAVTAEAVVGS